MRKLMMVFRDAKTGRFQAPILCPATPGEAERTALEFWKSEGTMIGKYPNDFPMYNVGAFDDETGQVTVEVPTLFLEATQLLTVRKEG